MISEIYLESCLDTMRSIPDKSVDLIVTSPPYDDLRTYNGYSFPFEEIAQEIFKVLKWGGVCIWVVGDQTKKGTESGTSFRQALYFKEIGFNLHDTMIYAKKNFIPQNNKRYEQQFEYMFAFSKGKPNTFNPVLLKSKNAGISKNFKRAGYPRGLKNDGSQRRRDETITVKETKVHSNIFYYSTGRNNYGHPAPFPRQLAHDQIKTWSNPGDIVYDPFGGSGTTIEQAELLDRKWFMSEISADYCDIARKRMEPILRRIKLVQTNIFEPSN